jgi:hypothetical protein
MFEKAMMLANDQSQLDYRAIERELDGQRLELGFKQDRGLFDILAPSPASDRPAGPRRAATAVAISARSIALQSEGAIVAA